MNKKIELIVRIPDIPGTLVELIDPISKNGGNIFSVLHHHDKIRNNMIPVLVSFELSQNLLESSLEKIKKELVEEKNFEIESITVGSNKRQIVVLLTGHVFDTDVADTIKKLASKNVKVSELHAKFTELSDVSNVKLKLDYPESMTEKELINELSTICREKNLILIRS